MNPTHQPYVERICRSDTFRTTPRLQDLLVFLTRDQNGNPAVLKESVIGVEFFHRDPGYDPKKDPIVRVESTDCAGACSTITAGKVRTIHGALIFRKARMFR
jgi:hypothetical protein